MSEHFDTYRPMSPPYLRKRDGEDARHLTDRTADEAIRFIVEGAGEEPVAGPDGRVVALGPDLAPVVGAERAVEIMGWRGLGWEGAPFTEDELAATRLLGSSKAGTIAGGSQEVQNNIIAKRILGLPDPISSAASR